MTDPFDVAGVDDLYEGDLEDFVKRRDDLARQLKQDGAKDVAAMVKQMRKPTTVMWAVNQVARRNREAVDDLVRAAGEVRSAQARAVQGKDSGSLRTSTNDWRNRVRALAADVAKVAGEQYRDDAAATLEAASTSEELAAVLKAGRLITPLSPSGFGLDGMPEPEARPAVARDNPREEKPPRNERLVKEAQERLDARESALERETHKFRRAEQRLEQARLALEDAEKTRDHALAARDEAATALRQAEGS
ncbi:MAG TPA: hypothetical protein VMZ22_13035 [Acidimicrobiales bacterium]|nr:hypothetical protein [Acidimicrobiales bacterium]